MADAEINVGLSRYSGHALGKDTAKSSHSSILGLLAKSVEGIGSTGGGLGT